MEIEAALFKGMRMTLGKIEDMFWNSIVGMKKKYSVGNRTSLFGDKTKLWNLNKFTSKESNIHRRITHHEYKVNESNIFS